MTRSNVDDKRLGELIHCDCLQPFHIFEHRPKVSNVRGREPGCGTWRGAAGRDRTPPGSAGYLVAPNLRLSPYVGTGSSSAFFRITTWGESHGGGVGVVVDGCPPRLKLTEADIQPDLDRRRPGQSKIVTPRKEDRHGANPVRHVRRQNARHADFDVGQKRGRASEAYTEMATKFRPSHADYTYFAKFGIRAWPGGGRTSARETIGRVAAGAIARKILRERFGVEVLAYVKQVQRLVGKVDPGESPVRDVESNIVRCPDQAAAEKMIRLIEKTRRAGDSVGGIIEGVARGVPPGWGEPGLRPARSGPRQGHVESARDQGV